MADDNNDDKVVLDEHSKPGNSKPRKKTFVPRAPKRRPPAAAPAAAAVVVKTEAGSEQVLAPAAATERPPQAQHAGRGDRDHRSNSAVPAGTVFFQSAAPKSRRSTESSEKRSSSVDKSAEAKPAEPLFHDDPMIFEGDEEEDPLAPIVFEKTSRAPIVVAGNEREEDEEEIRRARKSPLFPSENQLFVMQLPTKLPASLKRRRPTDESTDDKPEQDDLSNIVQPADGPIGKLQIFESGRVKLRLGDEYFDVSSGLECAMLQQIASLSDTTFAVLGNVSKKILVTVPADEEEEEEDLMMDLSSS